MKAIKLTLTAVFSILLALPVLAAEEGGNTGTEKAGVVKPGLEAPCACLPVTGGDLGVTKGTLTTSTASSTTTPADAAGSSQ